MSYIVEELVSFLLILAGAIVLTFLAYFSHSIVKTWVEKIRKKVKGPSEPCYVRTLSTDGRKYINSDEFINLPHVKRQMEKMSKLIKERGGQLEA